MMSADENRGKETMNAQVLIAVSAAISALATIVIAVLAGVNYRLSKNINETNENFKKQQAQLLIAIATSNIIAGSDSPGSKN